MGISALAALENGVFLRGGRKKVILARMMRPRTKIRRFRQMESTES
jgi:hypothetical protein